MELELYEKALDLVKRDYTDFDTDFIKLVWFTKTLKNWKAIIADIRPGGNFYEVTYNGEAQETYIDTYKKLNNVVVKDGD
jgi:hypothetical protein